MTTHSEQVVDELQRCWCCDNEFSPEEVVHLGAHPEVALCFDCARWVRRRAVQGADARRHGVGARLRRMLARIRAAVIGRGWHDRPVIGGILRWIDRRLP
ncbi:hypothetical protein HMPREF0063_12064 [Aeromicrobium marinum DSM 15272]|jgi:hypothetical protein|uniref:Uncharacterized protein n=1 Tax=Aeromicrobium marinum DSM 15272 TaxID=585531 RepID=E2SEC8_9ACTN|nr:hypothetical protein [Aeromicrobium marinum]EFQ82855.1 hypothetical protein HMPREF0063_12064 [Aeromicrobium marinum DSM 15272]